MPDPIASSEVLRSIMDAYRVFSQEMRDIGQAKSNLVKLIITRLDADRLDQAREKLKNLPYEPRP
jgi:hypothetical protein